MIRVLFNAIFILFNISKMERNKSFQRSKINNYRYKDSTYPHRIILYDSRCFIEPEDRRKLKRWRDRFFPFLFHGIFANVLLLTNTGDVSLEFPEGLIKRACCRQLVVDQQLKGCCLSLLFVLIFCPFLLLLARPLRARLLPSIVRFLPTWTLILNEVFDVRCYHCTTRCCHRVVMDTRYIRKITDLSSSREIERYLLFTFRESIW